MSTIRCPLYNKLIVNIQLLILQFNCKKNPVIDRAFFGFGLRQLNTEL